ncbi:antibiotic biosynthesis monooxygenase [soil metagenome]
MVADEATPAAPSTAIRVGAPVVTLVNVFTVAEGRQVQLIDILDRATRQVMRHLPGFVSANIHRSLDGTKVVNYAQWQTVDAFQAMLANPEARSHMQEATSIATAAPALYEVASVQQA